MRSRRIHSGRKRGEPGQSCMLSGSHGAKSQGKSTVLHTLDFTDKPPTISGGWQHIERQEVKQSQEGRQEEVQRVDVPHPLTSGLSRQRARDGDSNNGLTQRHGYEVARGGRFKYNRAVMVSRSISRHRRLVTRREKVQKGGIMRVGSLAVRGPDCRCPRRQGIGGGVSVAIAGSERQIP